MPVLHEYRDRRGMYIKARHGNSMATYQLTPAAVAELSRLGMREGSQIGPDILNRLVSAGLAYTYGSGAGAIDAPAPPSTDTITVRVAMSIGVEDPLRPSSPNPKKLSRQTPAERQLPASCPPRQLPRNSSFLDVVCVYCLRSDTIIEHNGRPWCGWCGRWAVHHELLTVSSLSPKSDPSARSSTERCAVQAAAGGKPRTDLAQLLGQVWGGIVYELAGIPVWLWLLIVLGTMLPGYLLLSALGR